MGNSNSTPTTDAKKSNLKHPSPESTKQKPKDEEVNKNPPVKHESHRSDVVHCQNAASTSGTDIQTESLTSSERISIPDVVGAKKTQSIPGGVSDQQPISKSGNPKLWDRDNEHEQTPVVSSQLYKPLLYKQRCELLEVVDPVPLLPHLMQLGVIYTEVQQRLQLNATQYQMVENLLQHLEKFPSWKLHGFFRACHLTGQSHVIHLLGLDPNSYSEVSSSSIPRQPCPNAEKVHFYKRSESDNLQIIPMDMIKAIHQHCESYNRNIMQTNLFGFKNTKPIDLTPLYIHADATCEKNERERLPIRKRQLFQQFLQKSPPRSVQLEGPAGAGKTTYLREYAYSWSSDFMTCQESGPGVPCQGHEWKLIVYIPAGSIRDSAEEAIKENLKCDKSLRDQTMAWIYQDGGGVLIIHDAVDELQSEHSKESLHEFTKTCKELSGHPKVLISARNGLCYIQPEHFHRFLHIDGFGIQQGVEYVEKYFKERYGITDHDVLQFVKGHETKLDVVLGNPLRSLIFSELTAKGSLTLDDVKTLNPIKLLKSLEGHIIRRETEHAASKTSELETQAFYQLCLQCLLLGERQFKEDLIDGKSPYKAFLLKHTDIDTEGHDITRYMFHHETIFEYFAVCGLVHCLEHQPKQKQAVLLYLCSNPNMRNILQLTSGFICQYKPKLFSDLVFIIRACLILQCEKQHKETEYTKSLLDLSKEVHQLHLKESLQRNLTEEESEKVELLWNQINNAFSEDASRLRSNHWFIDLYHDKRRYTSYILPFITECLHQGKLEQQKKLSKLTTDCLLPTDTLVDLDLPFTITPSESEDFDFADLETALGLTPEQVHIFLNAEEKEFSVWSVNSCRWAAVTEYCQSITQKADDEYESGRHTEIKAWCPDDVTNCLKQLISHHDRKPVPKVSIVNQIKKFVGMRVAVYRRDLWTDLDLDFQCSELWGPCPSEAMSKSAWDEMMTLSVTHGIRCINVNADSSSLVEGLLLSSTETIRKAPLSTWIRVYWGKLELSDLQLWASQCPYKIRRKIVLFGTNVTVPNTSDEESVRKTHASLSESLQESLIAPTYVDGQGRVIFACSPVDEESTSTDDED